MTLRQILGWWWTDLRDWWRVRGWQASWMARTGPPGSLVQPAGREGRMVRFSQRGNVMGWHSYTVWARRGQFVIGRLEYRNQWGYYAFIPDGNHHVETPLNREILGEIWAMLKELGS